MDAWRTTSQSDIDRWREAADAGDPDGALRIGEFLLQRAGAGRYKEGDDQATVSWLERAAELGGPPMMWRIAAVAAMHSYDIANRWQRAAIVAEWRDSVVDVDEDAFHLIDHDSWASQDFTVRVSGDPHDAVRAALIAAAPRLYCVGNDGIEYGDAEIALDSADYNPNFVSDPTSNVEGDWEIWMDCKGEAYPLMAATMLQIIADELLKAGVSSPRIGSSRLPGQDEL